MKTSKVILDNVNVSFSVSGNSSSWFKVLSKNKTTQFTALNSISFRVDSGERIGIIGHNGAGKSVLLKTIAGVYSPDNGERIVCGDVCSMFELATGFEMEQSGWDNIRVRGLLLGMSRDEIEEKLPSIAEFCELGDFLNFPVKTYSAGMFLRLAFAVSTSIQPDILLLDEIVGVGDAGFAAKAQKRMVEFMDNGNITILASHSLEYLLANTERVLWIDRGQLKADGSSIDVINEYKSEKRAVSD